MKTRLLGVRETENGMKWVVEQVYSIANELGIKLDCPPDWEGDGLNVKLGVEIAGQWNVFQLWPILRDYALFPRLRRELPFGPGATARAISPRGCFRLRMSLA